MTNTNSNELGAHYQSVAIRELLTFAREAAESGLRVPGSFFDVVEDKAHDLSISLEDVQ